MNRLPALLFDLFWLGAAAVLAWYFLWTFLGIEVVAGVVSLTLRKVERGWQ